MAIETIILGGGCFWCLEAIYQRVKGVETVINGYAGGESQNPTYETVCSGQTGHAEVVKVSFDTKQIPLKTILQIFWAAHNPTTLNRQGNDIGTQYRSAIFYQTKAQGQAAEASLKHDGQPLWKDKIVTEIKPLEVFYPAEPYHQNYFNNHPEQAYCQLIINPKLQNVRKQFAHLMDR